MNSGAFNTFENRISEVKTLLRLCSPTDADFDLKKAHRKTDNAILRGALVLLCSHMEGFFEDLVSDVVKAYDQLADHVGDLPVELCCRQILGNSDNWDKKDSASRLEAVKKWASHPLLNTALPKQKGILDTALHTNSFATPSTINIGQLFKSVGILDIWKLFQVSETQKIYLHAIDAIVNRRNQIAHGDLESTVTFDDVELYVERVERVAIIFNQIATDELNNRLRINNCWNALLYN